MRILFHPGTLALFLVQPVLHSLIGGCNLVELGDQHGGQAWPACARVFAHKTHQFSGGCPEQTVRHQRHTNQRQTEG